MIPAPMSEINIVLEELLVATGASRVTLRQDLPGDYAFPVTHESLAPGVASLREERTVDLKTQPVVALLSNGEQVVQDDTRAAFDDPAFQRMLDTYGGLGAQIVTPILRDGVLDQEGMRKEHMNAEEVASELRVQGVADPREVKLAMVEPDGSVSVLKQDWAETARRADLDKIRETAQV